MRITLIGPVYPYRGGIAHFTTRLAEHARQADHALQLVSFSSQYPRWLYPGASDREPGSPPPDLNAHYTLSALNPLRWVATAHLIQRHSPQVAIFQWWTPFWGPAFGTTVAVLRRQQIPITFIIHNVLPHERKPFDAVLTRQVLSMASRLIVMSQNELDRLHALGRFSDVRLTQLPVFDMFPGTHLTAPEARQVLGLPATATVLLFFGLVRPYKGLAYAIDALAHLDDNFHLLIAGEFWEDPNQYHAQIARLNLTTRVTILNRYISNEEVAVVFKAADVFLAPYLRTSQSAAAKTAIARDLPIVASPAAAQDLLAMGYHVDVPNSLNGPALAEVIRAVTHRTTPPALAADPNTSWEALLTHLTDDYA